MFENQKCRYCNMKKLQRREDNYLSLKESPAKTLFNRSFLSRNFFINYNRTLSNMPHLSSAHTLLQYWDSRFIRITWALWIIQLVFEFIVIQLIYVFSNSWKFMRFGIHSHGNSWVYIFTFIEVHGFSNSYS